MANQLEIIRDNGEIEFYNLDPDKGITNIGSHPENDIIIDSPGVAPFHAILDHRFEPYQLTLLSQEGMTSVGNQPLAPHIPTTLQNWDNIDIDGHRLILVGGTEASVGPGPVGGIAPFPSPSAARSHPPQIGTTPIMPAPLPARPATIPPPGSRPEGQGSTAYGLTPTAPGGAPPAPSAPAVRRPTGFYKILPPDQEDEAILIELSDREWTLDVEHTALFQLSIANGGDIVATFSVQIQGLDASWVEISQPHVNLFEGERTSVTISITPPRLPTSRAGAHHFAVIVTSSNYPGRYSQLGATLTINPYYEFAVNELSPKRQPISWFKHHGDTVVPITNKGNSNINLRVEGADDEHACSYEFDVPGEPVPLAKQAELRLPSEETVSIPLTVTPYSRRLIGLRRRTYSFTVTSTLIDGQQTPRSVLGELKSAPLIGPILLLLMTLLIVALILFLVRPRIYTFMFTDGGQQAVIRNGTPVAMRWSASYFTGDLTLDPAPEELAEPVPVRGTVETFPREDTTYILTGGNALSRIAPRIFPAPTRALKVDVVAIAPNVFFEAAPSVVVGEGVVVLRWQVSDADQIELFRQVGQNPEELIGDFSDSPEASLEVTPQPNQDTVYILKAKNLYVPTSTPVPRVVTVLTPTPTVPPTPDIIFFSANPATINEGEASTLAWTVNGAQEVTLQWPDNNNILPANHNIEVRPTASTDYTLIVPGVAPQVARVDVIPATPTPTSTPEPTAPDITFFTADPDTIVKGDDTAVELQWTVVGTTTNIELSSPELPNPLSNLQAEGTFKITLNDTALFLLTAFNDTAKTSASVQIETEDPTPVPPTPTPTPIPAEIQEFAIISPGAPRVEDLGGTNPHRYRVQTNTTVTFRWRTNAAANAVTFQAADGSVESGAVPAGSTERLIEGQGNKNYTLTAENAEGQSTTPQVITVEVVDQPPPNSPFNLLGVENPGSNENELTWNWTFSPDRSDIIGFRVYRATVPGNNFAQIPGADENSLPKGTQTFTDSVNPTCGRAYYVVAVYLDVQSIPRESPVSQNSWFSSPCP